MSRQSYKKLRCAFWTTDYMHSRFFSLLVLQEVITLETAAVKDATANILEMHSIPAKVSKDLLAEGAASDSTAS